MVTRDLLSGRTPSACVCGGGGGGGISTHHLGVEGRWLDGE